MTNGKNIRVDIDFERDMREIMKIRFDKGFARFNLRDLGTAEATRLLRKCDNYPKLLEELRNKPKKQSII